MYAAQTVTYLSTEEAKSQFEKDTIAGGTWQRTRKAKETLVYFYNDGFTWTLCSTIATRKDETTGTITYYNWSE